MYVGDTRDMDTEKDNKGKCIPYNKRINYIRLSMPACNCNLHQSELDIDYKHNDSLILSCSSFLLNYYYSD